MSKASQIAKKHNPNSQFKDNTKDETIVEPTEVPNKVTNEVPKDMDAIIDNFYDEQNKKELKQDISGNYTLVIKHDTMERLDELAEHYPRGFKSDLVNTALEAFVSLYEKKPLPPKRNKKKGGRR